MPERTSTEAGLKLGGLRELLLPFGFASAFVLHFVAHVPVWTVAAGLAPLLALFVWAPNWAAHSTRAFDRDLVSLLALRRPERLGQRYARALGMRLFAPPAVSAERRALVAAESGDARAAFAAYRDALDEYRAAAPLRVLLGYAHAAFRIEQDVEAIRVYRQLCDGHGSLPGVEINLAHALVRSGDGPRDAFALLDRALAAQPEPATRARLLMLCAIAHAKLGERDAARAQSTLASALGVAGLDELQAQLEHALEGRAESRL